MTCYELRGLQPVGILAGSVNAVQLTTVRDTTIHMLSTPTPYVVSKICLTAPQYTSSHLSIPSCFNCATVVLLATYVVACNRCCQLPAVLPVFRFYVFSCWSANHPTPNINAFHANRNPFSRESFLRSFITWYLVAWITLPLEQHLIGGEPILLTTAIVSGELAGDRLGLEEIRSANNILGLWRLEIRAHSSQSCTIHKFDCD